MRYKYNYSTYEMSFEEFKHSHLFKLPFKTIGMYNEYLKKQKDPIYYMKIKIINGSLSVSFIDKRNYWESYSKPQSHRCGVGNTFKKGDWFHGGQHGHRDVLNKKTYRVLSNRKERRVQNRNLKSFIDKSLDLKTYLNTEYNHPDHNCYTKLGPKHRLDSYAYQLW